MSATSVTGTGPGMALGPDGGPAPWKPENNGGCCGKPVDPPEPAPRVKRSCRTTYRSGGIVRYGAGSGTSIKVC